MRFAIVFFVSGLTGLFLSRCASPPLRTQIIDQQRNNEEAIEIAEKYIPQGKDRETVKNALAASSRLLEVTDKARTQAEVKAQEAEADAKKWRWLKGIAIASGVGLLIFGGFKAFRALRPV
jgi:hypothetical protein